MRTAIAISAVLASLAWSAVLLGPVDAPFTFDDVLGVEENPHLESLSPLSDAPLSDALRAPEGSGASGRPLVALSLALDHARGARDLGGYLRTNLVIHALAALALFGVCRRAIGAARGSAVTDLDVTFWAAWIAHLWSVHALHTMSLDNVIYRSESLQGLFYLTSLYAALRAFTSNKPAAWYVVAGLAASAAAASKEVAVSLPLVVLLYDRSFVSGTLRRALAEHRALYVGLAASWIVLALCVASGDRGGSVGFGLAAITPFEYLLTQASVLVHYLRLFVWPHPLSLDYSDWPIARSVGEAFWPGLVVLGALAIALVALVRRRAVGWLGVGIFLVLAPTSSVVPLSGALVGEHRMYLPTAALLGIVGLALGAAAGNRDPARARWIAFAAGLPFAIALGLATRARHADYFAGERSIWQATVDVRPNNARAWSSLGVELGEAEDLAGAESAYRRAIDLAPGYYKSWVNLGNLCLHAGRIDDAHAAYARAVECQPDVAEVHYYYGSTSISAGDARVGIRHLHEALALGLPAAQAGPATYQLAWTLATSRDDRVRDGARALELARELLSRGPLRTARALDLCAAAEAESGRFDEALELIDEALLRAGERNASEQVRRLAARRVAYVERRAWRE